MAEYTDLDQVWLVVTPQNPLKDKSTLLADFHRLALVKVAIDDNPKLRASDIEFNLPKPSYTITTLTYLRENYPSDSFSLIMGEDNLRTFHKWFNHEIILNKHKIYVYPRVLTAQEELEVVAMSADLINDYKSHENVEFCEEAPVMKVSSSFIRQSIKDGKDVRYLLTEPVREYVDEMNFYK
jgi:nicotinate-nucleotide adenylyltransferase